MRKRLAIGALSLALIGNAALIWKTRGCGNAIAASKAAGRPSDSHESAPAGRHRPEPGTKRVEASTTECCIASTNNENIGENEETSEVVSKLDALTLFDLGDFDMEGHILHVENEDCDFLNPAATSVPSERKKELRQLLKDCQATLRPLEQRKQAALWPWVSEASETRAVELPANEDRSDFIARLEIQNPPGARIISVSSSQFQRPAFLILNWGDFPEHDNTRLELAGKKKEVAQRIQAFFATCQ